MKRVCLILAMIINLSSFSQKAAPDIISARDALQDLETLYSALKENHPDIFANISREAAEKEFEKIKGLIKAPLSRSAFLKMTSAFVSGFRDGHTYMDINFNDDEIAAYDSTGGRFFPVKVVIIKDRLYAAEERPEESLGKGDEILTINNHSIKWLMPQLKKLVSADGEDNARASTERLFGYMLWVYGIRGEKFPIQYIKNNKLLKAALRGLTKEELLGTIFSNNRPLRQLHLFPDHSLAVVEINSYVQVEKSKQFIDSCFGVIKSKDIKNVALDLRKNGGGNSYIGDYFLGYVTKKTYNTISRKSWRLGPLLSSLPQDHYFSKTLSGIEKEYSREGEFLVSKTFEPQAPATINEPALFADVNFFLLTSARTYSSAHMTALAVKCGGLGTIIGQPTGERLDLTGEILEYTLPVSKLVCVIPTAAYKTGCGDGRQVGVQPDHLVERNLTDLKEGRDTELEVLKKMVKGEAPR